MAPPSLPIRVMVLEDDQGTREALATLLGGSPGFACVGAHATAEGAARVLAAQKPDVILVDLELPGVNGIEFLRTCRHRYPEAELVVLTVHDEANWVFPALEAGASGYIVKGAGFGKVLDAIIEVHSGGSSMSSQVARLVLQSLRRKAPRQAESARLSPRETEVLESLAQGMRQAEIADHLGISHRTVNTHLYRIYEKLHVHSAAGAVGKWLSTAGSH